MGRPLVITKIFTKPASTVGLAVIFLVFGLGLCLQQSRWSATPAYGNLLVLAAPLWWGLAYLTVGLGLVASLVAWRCKALSTIVHGIAFMIILGWEIAFIIRYATDAKTTIANVVAWAVYLFLTIRSARVMEYQADLSHHMETEAVA